MDYDQPYDFGANQTTQEDPSNKFKRIVIIIGGSLLAMIVIGVVASLILSKPDISKDLAVIAAKDSEVNRVAGLALASERASSDITNNAATTKTVSASGVTQLVDYAAANTSNGIGEADLTVVNGGVIDTRLEQASRENRFDKEYREIMGILLKDVNQEVLVFIPKTDDAALLAILQSIYDSNQLLLDDLEA